MPQASMLWSRQGWPLGSFFLDENFQRQIPFADIKENVLLVGSMVLIQHVKAQLIHIKILSLGIIMTNNRNMVNAI